MGGWVGGWGVGDAAAAAPVCLQVTTAGSSFNTLLAAYQFVGPTVNTALRVKHNDNCVAGAVHSCVTFYALPSTSYRLQVAGWDGAFGTVALKVTTTPATCVAPTGPCKKSTACCSRKCAYVVGSPARQCL